ncbi:MAG: ABC transporter ATP-binding protein [Phycisphaerales bacterium]
MTLAIRGMTFGYTPARRVFEEMSFDLPRGLTVVLGPNGAGKSTLLRLLLGSLNPAKGTIELDGEPVRSLDAPARAARIAYVSQRPSVASAFTVREVVALGRYALAADSEIIEAQIQSLSLASMAERVFASLSVGEQQRVSLARALAQLHSVDEDAPRRVLLADEPTSAMDPRWVAHTTPVLRSLPARGIDALIVLHDFTLAARLADAVLVLDGDGRIDAIGPPDETLRPDRLERVFGTPFTRHDTPEGPFLAPRIGTPT